MWPAPPILKPLESSRNPKFSLENVGLRSRLRFTGDVLLLALGLSPHTSLWRRVCSWGQEWGLPGHRGHRGEEQGPDSPGLEWGALVLDGDM